MRTGFLFYKDRMKISLSICTNPLALFSVLWILMVPAYSAKLDSPALFLNLQQNVSHGQFPFHTVPISLALPQLLCGD